MIFDLDIHIPQMGVNNSNYKQYGDGYNIKQAMSFSKSMGVRRKEKDIFKLRSAGHKVVET